MQGEGHRRGLLVLGRHLDLHLGINNACEHLSLLKFDPGTSTGTSSYVSFFKSSSADKTVSL